MNSERCNEARHNLHANQNGAAGDFAYTSNPGLSWWRLVRFLAAMMLVSFTLNEIWEMAQMSAYVETAGQPWISTLGFCTRASAGDAGIILGIYAAGAMAAGDPAWGLLGRWNIYATAAFLGLTYAVLVEHAALAAGRWTYSEYMPVVPLLGAGLWPLLQMTLLPPLAFMFARWWTCSNTTKGEFL
jgi:hypothetical protein